MHTIKLLHFHREILLKAKSTKLNLKTMKYHTKLNLRVELGTRVELKTKL